jgi:hypothetical protein
VHWQKLGVTRRFLLFIPTKLINYVKYIYLLPIICYMFHRLLHHLQGDNCIICSRTVCFLHAVTQVLLQNIKYTLMLKTYSACYSVQNNMWFVFLHLKNVKRYLKSLLQHINICWFLLFIVCVGNICMFTVSSCIWVSRGVEILRGLSQHLHSTTHPNTAG